MHFHFADVEITKPLVPLSEAFGADGIALLIRRHSRPIGFIMHKTSKGADLSVLQLGELIAESLKLKLISEAIVNELAVPEPARILPLTLTIVVCTRGRPAFLGRCLDSIQMLRARRNFELIVVDNAPPDAAAADVVNGRLDVRYIKEPRPGLDFARNRGWRASSGELISYLDDDVVVDANYFEGLDEACAENPDAGAFTGLVMPLKLDTRAQILFEKNGGFRRGFEKQRFGSRLRGTRYYPAGAGIFGVGCNMVIRRSVLEYLGGFDEALDTGAPLPGGGDLDIFYRIVRSNYPLVYEPRMMVFHEHRSTESALRRQYYTWGLSVMAFLTKTYRCDPEQRPNLRGLLIWWFTDQIKHLRDASLGRHPLPLGMVSAELWGGVVGLCGGYARSLRRVQSIRTAYP